MIIKALIENKEASTIKPFSGLDPTQTTINFFNNISYSYSINSQHSELLGCNRREWKEFLKNLGQNIEQLEPHKDVGDMVISKSEYKNPYGQNPNCVDYKECAGIDDLCFKIEEYAEKSTKLRKSTRLRDIRYIRGMADKNQLFPIDFLNPNYTQYVYHMDWYRGTYYDEQTGKNYYGLKQKKEAFELYLKACGIPKHYFYYELPSCPELKPVDFPNPDRAFDITRFDYYKDKEENWFYQFAHTYNFMVGPRAPDEMCVVECNMIDWDDCRITFPQPKRNWKLRSICLEEVFVNGKTRKSLKNYIDYHRNKFTTQYSKDYLFISPKTGRPFSPAFLGKKLSEQGKKVYPKFYPYMGRHFCATGRLIQRWLWKHPDPIESVKNFMDHSKRKNTERYTARAEEYSQRHNYDWFKRILKDKNRRGKYAEKSKQSPKTLVSHGNPSRVEYSPDQIRTGD